MFTEQILNETKDIISYVTARIPNMGEVVSNSLPKAIIDVCLGRYLIAYGNNPIAAGFLRDATRIPGMILSITFYSEIGYTGIKYDVGTILGLGVGITCKATVIATYSIITNTNILEPDSLALAGRISNYICEPLARINIIASRERQLDNATNQNYFSYFKENLKIHWLQEAYIAGSLRALTMDSTGELIKWIGHPVYIRDIINAIDSKIASYVHGKMFVFGARDDIWSKMSISSHLITDGILPITNIGGRFLLEAINSYILAPPTRIMQDFSGKFINILNNYIYEDNNMNLGLADNNLNNDVEVYDELSMSSSTDGESVELIS